MQADRVRPRRARSAPNDAGCPDWPAPRCSRLPSAADVVAQGLVVVEIFVAQHQRMQALSDQASPAGAASSPGAGGAGAGAGAGAETKLRFSAALDESFT